MKIADFRLLTFTRLSLETQPLSIIEDQALKVKKAQRNLSDREALLAKRNSNRQKAKELTQLIDDLKNSSLRINPELTQLEIRCAELEKELEKVKAAIDHHNVQLGLDTQCHQVKEIRTIGQSQRMQGHS